MHIRGMDRPGAGSLPVPLVGGKQLRLPCSCYHALLFNMLVLRMLTVLTVQEDKVAPGDAVFDYDEGLKLVTDTKSLLYLFGMRLHWR